MHENGTNINFSKKQKPLLIPLVVYFEKFLILLQSDIVMVLLSFEVIHI